MTKQRLSMIALAGLILSLGSTFAWAVDEGIVLVDMDALFTKYYKTELADEQLKEQAEEFNTERREMVENYETLQEEFNTVRDEAQNTALSEDVRNEKRTEAEDKLVELRELERKIKRFEQTRQKQLEDQQRRMRKRIVTEIREEIEDYARSHNYSAILDSSGQSLNGVEFVLYSDGRMDITQELLEILNKGKN